MQDKNSSYAKKLSSLAICRRKTDKTHSSTNTHSESGNIFFALFGAIALIGIIGASTIAIMRGPLATMVEVQNRTQAESEMAIASRLSLLEATELTADGDCDADGFVEPLEWTDAAGNGPTGGGFLPNEVSSARLDPWGTNYGYCAWDAGNVMDFAGTGYPDTCDNGGGSSDSNYNRLHGNGSNTDDTYTVIAIISAGADQKFDTTCTGGASPDVSKGGDDIVVEYTYQTAVTATNGLWNIKAGEPGVAEINKEIEVAGNIDLNRGGSGTGQLQLGAGSMIYPDQTVLSVCPGAANVNVGLLRMNTAINPYRLEICDASGWVSSGGTGVWTSGTGNDIYYNTGTPEVGIGTTTPSHTLEVVGTFDVTGAVTFGSTLDVTGATTVAGLTANNEILAMSDLTVDGDFYAHNKAVIDGSLDVGTTSIFNGAADFNSTLNVDGDAQFNGNLSLTNATSLLSVHGSAVIDDELTVNSDATINDLTVNTEMSVGGATILNDTLDAKGAISNSTGNVSINDALDVANDLDVNGNADIGGTMEADDYTWNGNDFTPATCASGSFNRWDGTSWQCEDDISGSSGSSGTGAGIWEVASSVVRIKSGAGNYTADDFVFGSPQTADDNDPNHDSRMFFDKSKSAFRAGIVSASAWDDANIGDYSFAGGYETSATGQGATAFGVGSNASGQRSFAAGHFATASGIRSAALMSSEASGDSAFSVGTEIKATGTYSMAFGGSYNTATDPIVSGNSSIGFFMGDQSGYNLSTANRMALVGGDFLIDDAGATGSNGCIRYNGSTTKLQFSHDCTTWSDMVDATSLVPGSDTQVIFNDGGALGADSGMTYAKASDTLTLGKAVTITGQAGNAPTYMNLDDLGDVSAATPSNGQCIVYNNSTGFWEAAACTASGTAVLSGITAATANNTINNAAWNQVWNWQLTGAEAGLIISENTASTGGTVGTQALMGINTLAASTATPLLIENAGANISFAVSDQASDPSPFVIDASGNVGIGTAAPASRLHVDGFNDTYIGYSNGGNEYGIISTATETGTGASYGIIANTTSNPSTAVSGLGVFLSNTNGYGSVFSSSTVTTGTIMNFAHSTSAFSGNMIQANLAAGSGSFSGNFIRFQNNSDQKFYVADDGEVGAYRYCDEDGNNCFTSNDVSGAADPVFEVTGAGGSELVRQVTASAPYTTSDFVFGSPQLADDTDPNHDARMFFDKSKGAFRAGTSTTTYWDNSNVGSNSFAVGFNTRAGGSSSFAAGTGTFASGNLSTAIGVNTTVTGIASLGIGLTPSSSGAYPTVSATQSLGIFLGDQSGYNLSTANRMALVGGDFMIDDAGATGSNGCFRYNGATSKLQFSHDCTTFSDLTTGGATDVTSGVWEIASNIARIKDAAGDWATDDFVFGSPQLADDTDATHDSRMFFDKSKGAFRAGGVTGSEWDDANVGTYSFAGGYRSIASGFYSTSIGLSTTASNTASVAFGNGTLATGIGSTALGGGSVASGNTSIAVGTYATSSGDYSTALGREVVVSGMGSMGIGLTSTLVTDPIVSANNSFGIFMGDQSGYDLTTANRMALVGGDFMIDDAGATGSQGCIRYRGGSSKLQYSHDCTTFADMGTASSAALSGITAATAINTIDSLNFAQSWNWSTLNTQTAMTMNANALTSGKMLSLASSSTAMTGSMFDVTLSGNNAANTGSLISSTVAAASSTAVPMVLTNGGAGLSFRVNDLIGGPDTTPFVIDAAGNVGVGTATPTTALNVAGSGISGTTLLTQNNAKNTLAVETASNTASDHAVISGIRSRGTLSATSAIANNDDILSIEANGNDGSSQKTIAKIDMQIDGTPDIADIPGRIVFSTTPPGNDIPTEKMRISGYGNIGIGDFSSDTIDSALHLQSGEIRLDGFAGNQAGCLRYDDAVDKIQYSHDCLTYSDMGSVASGTLAIDDLSDAYTIYDAGTTSNMILGRTSAAALTAGAIRNLFIGENSGATTANSTATTDNNTAIGYGTLAALTSGYANTATGSIALTANTTGYGNTADGYRVLSANTTGIYNTGNGGSALAVNTTGSYNVASGINALTANTSGDFNTALGTSALTANITGSSNTAIGINALISNTTGSNNFASGTYALATNVAGEQSTAVGYEAMRYANSSSTTFNTYNTAVGFQALRGSSSAAVNTGQYNNAFGHQALLNNTDGANNIAMGYLSMGNNTTGDYNVGIGHLALRGAASMSGGQNIGIGSQALYSMVGGNNNTAVGAGAGYTISSGNDNVALGRDALGLVTTGSDNLALGYTAGDNITTGSRNIIIGQGIDAASATGNDQLNIGDTIYGDLSTDQVAIGTATQTTGIEFKVSGTGGIILPSGTTAQRPTAIQTGMFRYNTTASPADTLEYYDLESSTWRTLLASGAGAVSAIDDLSDAVTDYATDHNMRLGSNTAMFSGATNNLFIGDSAGTAGTTNAADNNIALGYQSLNALTTGNSNLAIGTSTLGVNTTGENNIALGKNTLDSNTTGANNIAIGTDALSSSTTDNGSVAIGYQAMSSSTIGGGSVAIGDGAMAYNNGYTNVAIGGNALGAGSGSATDGVALGFGALSYVTSGNSNTALGRSALSSTTTGADNIAIGSYTGDLNTTGARNILIGTGVDAPTNATDDHLNIGNTIYSDLATDRVAIGTATQTASIQLKVAGTGGIMIPAGTDAQRPATGAAGMVRYNSTATPNDKIEYYDAESATWVQLTGGSGSASAINDLSDAYTDYATDHNLFMGSGAGADIATGGQGNLAIGENAGSSITTGSRNTMLGLDAGNGITTGGFNTIMGYQAQGGSGNPDSVVTIGMQAYSHGYGSALGTYAVSPADGVSIGSSAGFNSDTADSGVNVGSHASFNTTTGNYNTALGGYALYSNVAKHESTAIGYHSMYYADDTTTGAVSYNTALGAYSLQGSATAANNTGESNTAIGHSSLLNNTTGSYNVAVGTNTLADNQGGYGNTGIGNWALRYSNASKNTAIGWDAMQQNRDGEDNVAIGVLAMYSNEALTQGVAIGNEAMRYADNTSTGAISYNTAVGYQALRGSTTAANNTGTSNTAIGHSALLSTTSGSENTALGSWALHENTTGQRNVAIGVDALWLNTTGPANTAVGFNSLGANTTGDQNVAMGAASLGSNISGGSNTAVGYYSLQANTGGQTNTAVGTGALTASTGNDNTALGWGAGDNLTSGNNNIAVGSNIDFSNATGSDQLVIGNTIYGDLATDRIAIGTSSQTASIQLKVAGTGGIMIPAGTDAQRPATGAAGMVRYNSDATPNDKVEYYDAESAAWVQLAGGSGSSSSVFQVTGGVVNTVDADAPYATADFVFGSPQLADDTDATHDNRMFFDKSKGAFRAGGVTAAQWDNANVGDYSFAGGYNTTAGGYYAFAFGTGNNAAGYYSIAMGENNTAGATSAIVMGTTSTASGSASIAMGDTVTASGSRAIAFGNQATSTGDYSAVLGLGAAAGTVPVVSGNSSFGIFMGDQSGVDLAQANTVSIMGASGGVGIGTVTPIAALDVVGNIRHTGIMIDASDIRYKTDIHYLPDVKGNLLDRIAQVKGYTFRMKDDKTGQIEYGVIAQELERVFPELVVTDNTPEHMKSVNYVGLIAPLIEATKELKSENDALKAKMDAYDARFAALESDMDSLKVYTGFGISQASIGLLGLLALGTMSGIIVVIRRKGMVS